MSDSCLYYYIGDGAVSELIRYCVEYGHRHFFLVADPNTYRVLGEQAEARLRDAGIDVKRILITGHEIAADEHYAVQALVETGGEDRPFIAVGSGTITDITRFVSHRTHTFFLSLPTAPSVDGYTSTVAPMVISKYKATIAAHAPLAVFADLPTLAAAPRPMIAAGLGDLLGKYTSLADWQMGAILHDEPYDPRIEQMMRSSVETAVNAIDLLVENDPSGVQRLMDGLIEAGCAMLEFGDSLPASGSEHHIAHFWEMKLIQESRPAILHGAKVGVSTILSAQRYSTLRQMTRDEAERRLVERHIPAKEAMLAEIAEGYGPAAELIADVQAPLLHMTLNDVEQLKARILNQWDQIQTIASSVPDPDQIASWLHAVGGPTHPEQIGFGEADVQQSVRCAHYLRDRFTLNRLAFWLGIPIQVQLRTIAHKLFSYRQCARLSQRILPLHEYDFLDGTFCRLL
jgi:glycerol-1-phosphate dehydrogenase [NAD(P)+]